MSELAEPTEQHLIEPDDGGRADAVRIVDQRPAVIDHGVHHRVPVTAQIARDLRHGSTVATDLERRPPARSVGDRRPRIGDAIRTALTALSPEEGRRYAGPTQIRRLVLNQARLRSRSDQR